MNCFCIVPFTISTRPENICKIPAEHNQKMPSQSCGSPRLAPISGRSNKMCPGRGITLGLIIQNCHKAIATKKRMIYLAPTFYLSSSWLLSAGYCSHCSAAERHLLGLWSDIIHHMGHQEASCYPGTGLTSNNATPLSLGLSSDNIHAILLNTIQTQSRSRH